jgi:peptidoglycan/LPS O-acetylase OafA/YrhL
MRALAIVSVVQWHVTQILVLDEHLPMKTSSVATSLAIFFGMDLFFVLSGFLIGSILLRSLERSGLQHVRRFYLRRAFRTFPSYYVVLTFLALTTALTEAQRHHLPFEYVYLTNYMPNHRENLVMRWGWSLALEEQFYLVVPFLFVVLRWLGSDRARLGVLFTMWSSALVVRLLVSVPPHGWWPALPSEVMYLRTHTRFDTLVAGIVLAYVQYRWHSPIARWLESPRARAALALSSLACLWILINPWIFGAGALPIVRSVYYGTLTSVMYFGWVLLLLNGGDGWMQRALSQPIFRRIATLGYGVYLVHIPLCEGLIVPAARALVQRRGWSMGTVWPLLVGALVLGSLAMSYVVHVIVEKPSLRLRDRFAA